ncbi:SRPBCC family protein [Solirubrobacter sp. CPCC 204708]|uniref:SRPBCC family protein n=1 Tax=Solirubrobacter deserti TaxID=2282478 RepID=A0ABT4RTG9_9ACTN|nr:SRPBCC family protein [Solirubrobacter deserti]MBE2316359.1 SRPBCC family protein [Solirubrobacter deserti]MDA0141561.1 SRPBCC family protein [Solirubrobacter deserti]
MSDPVFLRDGARPAVRVERRYDHPIEAVWRAVTSPEGLAAWFPAPVRFAGDVADFGDSTGQVLTMEPPRRLVFTWGGDQLEFSLREDGAGTVFVLTHSFDDRAGAASFASGWEHCLQVLGLVLAGAPLPEPERFEARHEELVRAFGLEDPVVIRGDAGWSVRIERQLVVPAAVAWDRLRAGSLDVPNVLVKLGDGTGHGARLVVAVNGSDEAELEPATAWVRAAVARAATG